MQSTFPKYTTLILFLKNLVIGYTLSDVRFFPRAIQPDNTETVRYAVTLIIPINGSGSPHFLARRNKRFAPLCSGFVKSTGLAVSNHSSRSGGGLFSRARTHT